MSGPPDDHDPKAPPAPRPLDDELAELKREIDRITHITPRVVADPTGMLAALKGLQKEWTDRGAARPDAPEWRRRLDAALAEAFQKIVRDGQTVDAQGNITFRLDAGALEQHGAPVVTQVLESLEAQFVKKWMQPADAPPAASAAPKTFDGADIAGLLSLILRKKPEEPKK